MTFTRRNLPHLHFKFGIYFVTFRLYGSLPKEIIETLILKSINSKDIKDQRMFQKYDKILDSGKYGSKYLMNEKIADIVKNCLHYPDNNDYKLICYCIMSNHVHVVFELLENNKGLSKIMQSIKRISARKLNEVLNKTGTFWKDESFDRLIRDEKEFYKVLRYVLMNPVKAGLVEYWKDWKNSYCHPDFEWVCIE